MKEPQLSLFKGYPNTVPDTITLQGIINLIQNDPSVHDHTKKYCYYHEQGSLSAATRKKCPCRHFCGRQATSPYPKLDFFGHCRHRQRTDIF